MKHRHRGSALRMVENDARTSEWIRHLRQLHHLKDEDIVGQYMNHANFPTSSIVMKMNESGRGRYVCGFCGDALTGASYTMTLNRILTTPFVVSCDTCRA
jgi:hypothetical protein